MKLTSGARLRFAVSACLAAAGGANLVAASPSPASPPPRIVYGGDASFPPYEYLDARGQPRGFNVALLRLLAEESGARVEFRLWPRSEVMQAFDAGQVDVVSLAFSPRRVERYDYLMQTWTLRRGFLMRQGRARYPKRLDELQGEVVACEERGQIHEALLALPPQRRPALRPVASQLDACRLLMRGEATIAEGNSLTLRHDAAEIGLTDIIDLEIESYPYYLATRKGRGGEMAFLKDAFERVRYTSRYHAVVERSLVLPERPRTWLDYWKYFAALAAALVGLAAGSFAWTRSLRAQLLGRTQELQGSLRHRKQLATSLQESETRFRGMIDGLSIGVVQHGGDGAILFANPAALQILGVSQAELLGRRSLDPTGKALHEDGSGFPPEDDPVRQALCTGRPVHEVVMGILRGGERVWLLVSAEPELGADGSVKEVIATFADISERRRSQEQMRYLAYHDSLTGLPNRELFLDRLTVAVAHASRHKQGLAVLFIDLDQFKVINDSLGHTIADQLVQATGQRIRAALRDEDTVARMGGDEFTVMLAGVGDAIHASRVAEKLQHAIKQPLTIDARELSVSASIGIGLFPSDGEDALSLLKNADTAMYRAKELGRDQNQFYAASMSARILKHLDLDGRLRRALANGRLEVHYQPFVELGSGRIGGVEALVRWNDPERGMIPPDDFIPLAEATGLIAQISAFVLRTACAEHAAIASMAGGLPLVAVNLSARQFYLGSVVEQVQEILDGARLDPGRLELEITETVAMQDHAHTVETLRRLKDLGVRLSIDDFGTGYSSLSYLRRFPVDTLKIDRSFVRDVALDRSAAAIVGAIIAVARELGLRVVAEGVETEAQLEFVRAQRCDAAQGYLLARPAPASHLPEAFNRVARFWAEWDVRSPRGGAPS